MCCVCCLLFALGLYLSRPLIFLFIFFSIFNYIVNLTRKKLKTNLNGKRSFPLIPFFIGFLFLNFLWVFYFHFFWILYFSFFLGFLLFIFFGFYILFLPLLTLAEVQLIHHVKLPLVRELDLVQIRFGILRTTN